MTEKAKLAAIGVGRWAGLLAAAVETSGEGEIVSCFARTEDGRKSFAEQYNCRPAGSLDELLSDPEVEGVLIATSHTSHRSLVEAAAAAGKHIFVEKPLAFGNRRRPRLCRGSRGGRRRSPGRTPASAGNSQPADQGDGRGR